MTLRCWVFTLLLLVGGAVEAQDPAGEVPAAVDDAAAAAPPAADDAPPPAATDSRPPGAALAALAERHRRFLAEVSLLISDPERETFLSITQPHQRDRFVQRFWQVRDPFPQTGRNEFKDRWEANAEVARARFVDLEDPRAQMILFFGEESRTLRTTCSDVLLPIEIWYFDDAGAGAAFTVVFIRRGDDVILWSPHSGLTTLASPFVFTADDSEFMKAIAEQCPRGDEMLLALQQTADWEELRDRLPLRPARAEDWIKGFLASSTDVPEGATELPASHKTSFPGVHQSRTVVQVLLTVPRDKAVLATTGTYQSYNFLVDGEVLRQGELFETFRYKFNVPVTASQQPSDQIPLALERNLRAGTYTWIVKLEDINGKSFYQLREEIDVPNVVLADLEAPSVDPLGEPPEPDGRLEYLAEANASLRDNPVDSDQAIKLWAPRDRLLTGAVRVEAKAFGEKISRVAFDLDGKQVMAKAAPPYTVEINLGRAPRLHRLSARALDAQGKLVATDEVLLNAGPHHFSARLIEPQRGGRYTKSVRARAEVEVPEGEALERVEFYLNETLMATLYQPPFVQPIAIPPKQELAYVRAVAFLTDGNSTEDLVFVNSPYALDEVQVDFVELYTSVYDSKGHPVDSGLTLEDFAVKEDGIAQSIRRFEPVAERPIHAGILLDNSTSMLDSIDEAEKAALQFFQSVIQAKDRACLITFNDSPELVVPFTNDHEVLAGGLAGLTAEGETALHDSLVYALHYFSGLRGKRALILLSDGEDVGSAYTFDEALDFARRTGVPIYTIGLGVAQRDAMARTKLIRLAQDTGGRSFFIDSAEGLTSTYSRIETELRAQYLIAYQSSQGAEGGDRYREVDLEIKKPGMNAKTMRGYYP